MPGAGPQRGPAPGDTGLRARHRGRHAVARRADPQAHGRGRHAGQQLYQRGPAGTRLCHEERRTAMSRIHQLFEEGVSAINVGIEFFKDDIRKQGASVAQVDWRPPGGGKPEVIAALDRLSSPQAAARITAANEEAVRRIVTSQPMLVGFARAIDVVPGMTKTTILHSGPPITWARMNGAMKGAVTGA